MRALYVNTLFVLVPLFGACSPAPQSSDLELCKTTYHKYPEFRDNPVLGQEYGNLFSETGTFSIGNNISNGRDAIIQRHMAAHKSAVWVHKLEEPEFKEKNGKVFAKGDVVVLTGPDKDNLTTRIEGHYADAYEVRDGRCRIKTRKTTVVKTEQIIKN